MGLWLIIIAAVVVAVLVVAIGSVRKSRSPKGLPIADDPGDF